MANKVFANGREVACKAAAGKAICAFPDVCFTPPENPATPPGVPIPYPNTGMASDMTSGSKKVKISNKEVMLKNKSYFKKSTGDEAGAAAKKGVITSTNRGKVYFNAWSMDVKFEGENVVRHLDLTTHNHASSPGNSPPMTYIDGMAVIMDKPEDLAACDEAAKAADNADNAVKDLKSAENSYVVAGAKFVPASGSGTGYIMRGASLISSNMVIPGGKYARFARNIVAGAKSNIPNHVYRPSLRPKSGHAETKILEDLFKGRVGGFKEGLGPKPPGKLYLSVKHKPICCDCQSAIDAAQKAEVQVIFCPPTTKEKCE